MIQVSPDLLAVLDALRQSGARPYLVGGCVRDALRGHRSKDLDIEVFGTDWERLLGILQGFGPADVIGRSFAVAKLRLASGCYDFALPRRESKTGAGHRGFLVEPDPALSEAEACARRDFTINALLFDPFTGDLRDFFHGRDDLERGVLRHTSPAFSEDPLRVLRGFQFAARFNLAFAPETARLCAEIAGSFKELPDERVWGEWEKFASQAVTPSSGLRALKDSGWMRHFPEIAALDGLAQEPEWHPEGDVFIHTGHCLDALARLPAWLDADAAGRRVLTFAVLGHDFGKADTTGQAERNGALRWISPGHDKSSGPKVDSFLEKIGSPLEVRPVVRALVENHHAHQSWPADGPTPAAVRRLARKLQPATITQLLTVMQADHLGRPPLVSPETTLRLDRLRDAAEAVAVSNAAPQPILRGRDLLAAGVPPGKRMGVILKNAFEAQLDGAFANLPGALAWARERFEDMGK